MAACRTFVTHDEAEGYYYDFGPGSTDVCIEPLRGDPEKLYGVGPFVPIQADSINEIDYMIQLSPLIRGGLRTLSEHVMGGGVVPSRVGIPADEEPFPKRYRVIQERWTDFGAEFINNTYAHGFCVVGVTDDVPTVLHPSTVKVARRSYRGTSQYKITLSANEWPVEEFMNAAKQKCDFAPGDGDDNDESMRTTLGDMRTPAAMGRAGVANLMNSMIYRKPDEEGERKIQADREKLQEKMRSDRSIDPVASFSQRRSTGMGWSYLDLHQNGSIGSSDIRTGLLSATAISDLAAAADSIASTYVKPARASTSMRPETRKRSREAREAKAAVISIGQYEDEEGRDREGSANELSDGMDVGAAEEDQDDNDHGAGDDNIIDALAHFDGYGELPQSKYRRNDPATIDPAAFDPAAAEADVSFADNECQQVIRRIDRRLSQRPTIIVTETHAPHADGSLNSSASSLVNGFWMVMSLQSSVVHANKQLSEPVGYLEHVDRLELNSMNHQSAVLAKDMDTMVDLFHMSRSMAAFDAKLVQQFRAEALRNSEKHGTVHSNMINRDPISGEHIIARIDPIDCVHLNPLPPGMRLVAAPRPVPPPDFEAIKKAFEFTIGVSTGVPVVLDGDGKSNMASSQHAMELFSTTQRSQREIITHCMLDLITERWLLVDLAYLAYVHDSGRLPHGMGLHESIECMRVQLMLPGMVNAPLVNSWFDMGMVSARTWASFSHSRFGVPLSFLDGPRIMNEPHGFHNDKDPAHAMASLPCTSDPKDATTSEEKSEDNDDGEENKDDERGYTTDPSSAAAGEKSTRGQWKPPSRRSQSGYTNGGPFLLDSKRTPTNVILTNGPEIRTANGSRAPNYKSYVPEMDGAY